MKRITFLRRSMLGTILGAALVMVACESTPNGGMKAANATDHAVVCPKCETIWIARPTRTGPRNIDRLQYSRAMTCPTCEKMAAAYLQGEKVVMHECPDCKATPKVYEPRRPLDHTGHKHQ